MTVVAVMWFVTPLAMAQVSSSPSYILDQATASAGGAPTMSASFVLDGTSGQESAVGTSSSPRFIAQSGFWSFVGSGLVPVILTAIRNGANPALVDLSWSGNNSPYDVYQGTDCSDIFSYYLTSVPASPYTATPPPSSLTCYSVLATAPGPIAPQPPPPVERVRAGRIGTPQGEP